MISYYSFECKVCFSPYNDTDKVPLILPCGHTYCEGCIKSLYKNRRIECPNRCKTFQFNSLSAIKKNFEIVQAIEKSKENANKYCNIHKDKILEFYCNDCKKLICKECLFKNHKKHDFSDSKE